MLINLLTYLSFILFSFGQLGRLSFSDQQINIYLFEIIVILLTIILLFEYKLKPIVDSFRNFKSIFLFFGALLFSSIINIFNFNINENLVAFLYLSRLLMYFVFFIYFNFYVTKEKKQNLVEKGIFTFIVLTIIFSLVQYFLYPDLRNLFYLGWDPHLYRMFGLFFDTSIAGAIYGLIFLYLIVGKLKLNRYIRLILVAAYFIFIVLTFSRSLYLAITFSVFIIFIKRKSFKILIFYSLLFILLLILAPKPAGEGVNLLRLFSVESRKESYIQAIKIWQKKPIFGIGYNNIRYEKIKTYVKEYNLEASHAGASFHSSFLIILVCGGVVGLLLFIYVLYQLAINNQLFFILIIFLSLLSLSDNILLHPFILFQLLTSNLSDK